MGCYYHSGETTSCDFYRFGTYGAIRCGETVDYKNQRLGKIIIDNKKESETTRKETKIRYLVIETIGRGGKQRKYRR